MNIDLVNIFSWLVFGFLAGYIAHLIDPTEVKGGMLATAAIGILGALIGGFLAYNLFGVTVTGFNLESFIIAVTGALILAFLYRLLFRNDNYRLSGVKGGKSKRKSL